MQFVLVIFCLNTIIPLLSDQISDAQESPVFLIRPHLYYRRGWPYRRGTKCIVCFFITDKHNINISIFEP